MIPLIVLCAATVVARLTGLLGAAVLGLMARRHARWIGRDVLLYRRRTLQFDASGPGEDGATMDAGARAHGDGNGRGRRTGR